MVLILAEAPTVLVFVDDPHADPFADKGHCRALAEERLSGKEEVMQHRPAPVTKQTESQNRGHPCSSAVIVKVA